MDRTARAQLATKRVIVVRFHGLALAAVTLSVTAVAGVTACGASGPAATAAVSSGSRSTATTADTAPQALGATVTLSTGDTYAVLAFQSVTYKDAAKTLDPTSAVTAANVKGCAGPADILTTDPTVWTLTYSGQNQATGGDASVYNTSGAPLPTPATVRPGQCITGWVAFKGFADGTPIELMLNGTKFRWLLK